MEINDVEVGQSYVYAMSRDAARNGRGAKAEARELIPAEDPDSDGFIRVYVDEHELVIPPRRLHGPWEPYVEALRILMPARHEFEALAKRLEEALAAIDPDRPPGVRAVATFDLEGEPKDVLAWLTPAMAAIVLKSLRRRRWGWWAG